MKWKRWNLRKRMMTGFIAILATVSVIIALLFWKTSSTMSAEYRRLVQSSVEGAVYRIDALVSEIYNTSDYFAYNQRLDDYLDKKYTSEQSLVKKMDTIMMYNKLFVQSDMLQEKQKFGGIYTAKGVLFNFEDVNCDGQEVAEHLEALGINDPDHLMRFYWYPLQDNFMMSDHTGDPRRDKAVFGSRRVYSVWKADYVCTHIFCIHEEALYEAYRESVVETKGDIYLLDEEGNLLSSSNEECVAAGQIGEELKHRIMQRTEDDFIWKDKWARFEVCVRQSGLNKWLTVAVIPQKSITGEINALYLRIYAVLVICFFGCLGIFLHLYQSFLTPVNELNQAMREVHDGNLNAFVKETGRNEIAEMMQYYNAMLRSIQVHVVEKLESERKKKELELEVLMGQINPHFLYNTLENIVWKSNEAGHPDIGRLAAMLGRMYRLSISGGQTIVTLQQELEHLTAYERIQKNRYGDSFELDVQVDRERTRQLFVLKILLQPIVENSFLYGMDDLERRLLIRLRIREKGEMLEIRISDNGRGMTKERLLQVRRQIAGEAAKETETQEEKQRNHRSTGIGLHNVAARITLYFGIEHPIQVFSRENMGTLTVVRIPVIIRDEVDEKGEYRKQKEQDFI